MEKSSILEHLLELRNRLIKSVLFFLVAFVVAYVFAEEIYAFLVQPLADLTHGEGRRMIFTGLAEGFFTYIKLALFAGFILAFPFLAAQGYMFLAPGLYKNERGFLIPFLVLAPALFACGAAIVYYYIMPLAWAFFLQFETVGVDGSLPIQMEARISEYLSLVMHLIIGFGLAFQLPIILLLLAKTGVIDAEFLAKRRKYAVVIIIIMAAILTPPDVISQLGLAGILYALYEISILAIKIVARKKDNA